MNNKMKTIKYIPLIRALIITACLIMFASLASTSLALGKDSPDSGDIAAGTTGEEELFSTFIPCITKEMCGNVAPSPFALQIAGLSDYVPINGLNAAEIEQMKALQLAEYNEAFPTMIQMVKESGAGWARVYIDWSMIQPTDPAGGSATYDWSNYDNWLGQVASEDVQIIATISNPPTWAAVDKSDSATCTNMIRSDKLTDFYNFVSALVNRYKASPYYVRVWEMLNEPDAIDGYRCSSGVSNYGDHGVDYANLLPGAYQAVKNADSSAKVIMGGIAYDLFYLPFDDNQFYDGSLSGKFNRYFTDDIVNNGAASYLDAVNFHYFQDFSAEWERWTVGNDGPPTCGYIRTPGGTPYYPYGLDLVAKGSHFLNRLSTCFNVHKPLWITEVGMHGIDPESTYLDDELIARYNDGQTLENQARYVIEVFARGLSLGAENITWYAIKINPTITPGDYQGLLYDSRDGDKENQPKPAYYAFQTLMQELKGYAFKETLSTPINAEAYSFTHTCLGTKIIGWANDDRTIPLTISGVTSVQLTYRPLAVGVEDFVIIDGDANDLDSVVNGSITVPLVSEPAFIQPIP